MLYLFVIVKRLMLYQDICVYVGAMICCSPTDNWNFFKCITCITIWINISCVMSVCNWDEFLTKEIHISISISFISCISIGSGFRYCCIPPYPSFSEQIFNQTIVIMTSQGCLQVCSTHYRSTRSNSTDLVALSSCCCCCCN